MNANLLLVEDDPVSAAFLEEALAALPARVHVAGDLAAARAALAGQRFDLCLVDANLPDGHGRGLLAGCRGIPALALTADDDPAALRALEADGFAAALAKPLGVATLHAAVRAHLALAPAPRWDDASGLAAVGGNAASLSALRRLFLDELPAQRRAIRLACERGEAEQARAVLHRLKASCGFVGAARLLESVRRLHESPAPGAPLGEFEREVGALLSAP